MKLFLHYLQKYSLLSNRKITLSLAFFKILLILLQTTSAKVLRYFDPS